MPIRFRCAYCNQLLGISRRKAGTVVRCPNCAGQVVVPSLDEAGVEKNDEAPPAPAGGATAPAGQHLFEGNEIDKLLEGADGDHPAALQTQPAASAAVPAAPPAPAAPKPAPAPILVQPLPAPPPATSPAAALNPGIWLSPGKATMLSVFAVVALAISFGIGLMVGLFLHGLR